MTGPATAGADARHLPTWLRFAHFGCGSGSLVEEPPHAASRSVRSDESSSASDRSMRAGMPKCWLLALRAESRENSSAVRRIPVLSARMRRARGRVMIVAGQPIELVDGEGRDWPGRFRTVAQLIGRAVPDAEVEHIGSTSVNGLPAKDVVDVLIGVEQDRWPAAVAALEQAGFICEGRKLGHSWLCAPSTERREVVLHVVVTDSREWTRRVTFRDLLRRSADARQRYLQIKREAAQSSADWGEYTAAKGPTVRAMLDGDAPD